MVDLPTPSTLQNDNQDSSCQSNDSNLISMEVTRAIAIQALALTVQDWAEMGQGDDPSVSEAVLFQDDEDGTTAVERVTALLLVRIVALQLIGHVNDLSTSGICRQALLAEEPPWFFVTQQVLDQLHQFVRVMLNGYSTSNPFHNRQHAVTVVVSCNKLLDLILADTVDATAQLEGGRPWAFGLRHDPLPWAALLFAALCHDVHHGGVTNRQLVLEDNEMALIYNDQSVQEKHSLHTMFQELLLPDYEQLRCALFGDKASHDDNYMYFRTTVISAVLSTDISSPEQTETTKSKWKEAFHHSHPAPTLDRNDMAPKMPPNHGNANRRGSNFSEISEITTPEEMIDATRRFSYNRRLSSDSNFGRARRSSDVGDVGQKYNNQANPGLMYHNRRLSNSSHSSSQSELGTESLATPKANEDAVYRSPIAEPQWTNTTTPETQNRRSSIDTEGTFESFAQDSVMARRRNQTLKQCSPSKSERFSGYTRRKSNESFNSFASFMQDSVTAGIAKRKNATQHSPCPEDGQRDLVDNIEKSESFSQDSPVQPFDRAPKTIQRSNSGPIFGEKTKHDLVDTTDTVEIEGKQSSTILESFEIAFAKESFGGNNTSNFEPQRGIARAESNHTTSSIGFASLAGESIGISHKRLNGGKITRYRSDKPKLENRSTRENESELHSPQAKASPRNSKTSQQFKNNYDDDDASLSLTPPSSDDEYQEQRQREISALSSMLQKQTLNSKANAVGVKDSALLISRRRASTGMVSSRFEALSALPIEEDAPSITHAASADVEFDDVEVHISSNTENTKFRKRLGIRRSIDFSGETLEIYKRQSMGEFSMVSGEDSINFDEADYLRALAILEALLRAADVGHYFQSVANMSRWSSRMYFEILKAHNDGRGHDPNPQWFDNQIRIMDSYLRPLALHLDESGVFGEFTGAIFVQTIDDIKEWWLVHGYQITEKIREDAVLRSQEPRDRRRSGMDMANN